MSFAVTPADRVVLGPLSSDKKAEAQSAAGVPEACLDLEVFGIFKAFLRCKVFQQVK